MSNEGDDHQKEQAKRLQKNHNLKQFRLVEINFPSNIIKAQGINRLRWDLTIIILAIYQALTIPISIAYGVDELNSPIFKTVDSLIDLVFWIDIILNFRTSFVDSLTGEEVLDPVLISKKYLSEPRFYIDVLSTIPFGDLTSSHSPLLQFLGILKIVRLLRISSVIVNLNTSQDTKAAFKVAYLIFTMFMYIRIMGCTWYMVVEGQEIWIPNNDFIWFGNP